jgi:hypothetical protein
VLAIAAAVGVTMAQAPAGPPPPGPEHKQLQYFVGKWTSTADMKASPFAPAGKMTGTDVCEAFTGGYHVVCRNESKGPSGTMKGIGLLGYHLEDKQYTYMGIDSMGSNDVARGTMTDADTWVYTAEGKMAGKTIKSRYTIKKLDADNYTFTWEYSDGGPWTVAMEGKDTRVKTKGTS